MPALILRTADSLVPRKAMAANPKRPKATAVKIWEDTATALTGFLS